MSIPKAGSGVSVPRNLRNSCFAFNAVLDFELDEDGLGKEALTGFDDNKTFSVRCPTGGSALASGSIANASAAATGLSCWCSFMFRTGSRQLMSRYQQVRRGRQKRNDGGRLKYMR
jgi:hypothetical protein